MIENIENIENEDFEELSPNMQKYFRYKSVNKKLKIALEQEFYLEAITIIYALVEDRVNCIIYRDEINKVVEANFYYFKPLKLIEKKDFQFDKQPLAKKLGLLCFDFSEIDVTKYKNLKETISVELVNSLKEWIKKRNQLVHVLVGVSAEGILVVVDIYEQMKKVALEGKELIRQLNNASERHKRRVKNNKEGTNGHN